MINQKVFRLGNRQPLRTNLAECQGICLAVSVLCVDFPPTFWNI